MKRYKKNLLAAATFLFCSLALSAQSADQNYVKSQKMLNASKSQKITSVQYYDGYSRPVLQAGDGTAGGGKYTFTLTTYDNVGRVSESWLPAVGTTSSDFIGASQVQSLSNTTYGDSYAYTCNHYDALGRTTSVDGIGSAWRSAGKKVTTAYGTNTWNEVRKYTATSGSTTLSYSTYYGSGVLSVETMTDEDGKTHAVYKDATGKTILERSAGNHDTYYVYDNMNRLRFVLPPCAADALATTGSWSMDSNDVLRDYAYYYEYDGRGRCIKKKLPGAEHILYEYDTRDRMTFSQDGVQRTSGKWTFYVYDNLNRLLQQGENTSKSVSTSGVYLQNYYDDYSFVGSSEFTGGYYIEGTVPADGLLTASVITTEGGNGEKVRYAYYYDEKGRLVKTVHSPLRGGTYLTTTSYTFTDKPLQEQRIYFHGESGVAPIVEYINYSYDSSDRIQKITHQRMGVSGLAAVELVSYTYDSLGRMSAQTFHNGGYNSSYAYNVRGWLTGINNNKFSQTLSYGSYYNGNISAMNWTANGSSHSYAFTYDDVNRMLNATHGTGAYTEKVTGYDKNGNITGLQRYGNGLIDNLTYTYNGNQLTKVEDATGNTAGFKNGASQANEYNYDNNGNLTKDLNKGITNISYNSLNLPKKITYSDGSSVTYLYGADGKKYRTVHVIGGVTTTTEYIGNLLYINNTPQKMLTEVGYMDLTDNTYYYYLKDHQGNNRVVVNSSGAVQEVNHYYPFGSTFATSNVQPYKYNGKELDTKNGLNWYDYGARHYDAVLGRWHVVDPLAEKYYSSSPFVYCGNNPINRIDPTGMEWEDDEEAERLKRKVEKKMKSLKRENDKKQSKLDKGGLSDKKVKRLKAKIAENQERISHLQTSLNDIDLLSNDKNNVYAFSKTDGGEHRVKKAGDGRVLIETSSDALSLHEISHVRQSLTNGGLQFSKGGELYNAGISAPMRNRAEMISNMEIEAYRIQYSYDTSFPGRTNNLQGINVHSVGGIVNTNGQYIYPSINSYSRFLQERSKLLK